MHACMDVYSYIHTCMYIPMNGLKVLGHTIFLNSATTLTNDNIIRLEGVWHDVVVVVVIYNIYIIYIIVKSLSRFRSDFLKKIMK
jgi:hypothetical protein